MVLVPKLRLLAVLVPVVVALAGCTQHSGNEYSGDYPLISAYSEADGKAIFEILLSAEDFKDLADRVAPVTVAVVVHNGSSEDAYGYRYAAGEVTIVPPAEPDFTLTTSRDLVLAVLNADDGLRVFTCALKADAATLDATNVVYAASFNGAKGRIMGSTSEDDCRVNDGQEVTFKILKGDAFDGTAEGLPRHIARMRLPGDVNMGWGEDILVYNTWRAPAAWLPANASTFCAKESEWKGTCGYSGYKVPSSALKDCTQEVKKAYGNEDGTGWEKGLTAAQTAKRAAELAACKLVFGGSN